MIPVPFFFVALLLLSMVFISHRILTARRHVIEGHIFMEYAKDVFKENDDLTRANEIDKALGGFLYHRMNCSKRFLIIQISQLLMSMQLLLAMAQVNVPLVSGLAAIAYGYTIMSYSQTLVDRAFIDSVCNGVDAELKKIGCTNAFADAMNKGTKDDPHD